MTILDQLEQTVTHSILRQDHNTAYVALLEQFYAILIVRLAQPTIYNQLLYSDQDIEIESNSPQTLFEQIWQYPKPRQLLIDELSAIYYVDIATTKRLLKQATELAYPELKNLADGQYLPTFLQTQQSAVQPYLPVWAEEVIAVVDQNHGSVAANKLRYDESAIDYHMINDAITADQASTSQASASQVNTEQESSDQKSSDKKSIDQDLSSNTNQILAASAHLLPTTDNEFINPKSAIHASPSDYHDAHTFKDGLHTRTRHRKNTLIVQASLLIGLIAVIALAWVVVIQPHYGSAIESSPEPSETVAVAAMDKPVTTESTAANLPPAEIEIGVDDSGNLYTCTATVGDNELKNSINEVLNISFGEQASGCELTVQEGVAKHLSDMDIETLPELLTLLRVVPFARLKLQNNTLNVEAPDESMLQRLLTDMRTLVPALTITSATPLPNNGGLMESTESVASAQHNEFINENMPIDNLYDSSYPPEAKIGNNYVDYVDYVNDNGAGNNDDYQQADDDENLNDRVIPAPARNTFRSNVDNNNTASPSGSLTTAEVDDLANLTIVAEQLDNERPFNSP